MALVAFQLPTLVNLEIYSHRSARIGSIPVALRAGRYPASSATDAIPNAASVIVGTSVGRIPNNCVCTSRVTTHAEGSPMVTPTAASSVTSRITRQITRQRLAPRAIRIPISRVRRTTMYAITP